MIITCLVILATFIVIVAITSCFVDMFGLAILAGMITTMLGLGICSGCFFTLLSPAIACILLPGIIMGWGLSFVNPLMLASIYSLPTEIPEIRTFEPTERLAKVLEPKELKHVTIKPPEYVMAPPIPEISPFEPTERRAKAPVPKEVKPVTIEPLE